ncbi:MAG: N-acetylmuramoyl-L-alanine amidase [Acidobacteria bacterium]|nr:N-acetylmuramoyl-L-alanine amidase [Acidobacteriota bacterium]
MCTDSPPPAPGATTAATTLARVCGWVAVLFLATLAGAQNSEERPTVRGIRHWSTAGYTRISIDLDRQVKYEVGEVSAPQRVYFDLPEVFLASGPNPRTYDIDDGLVKRVRVAMFSPSKARVVIELSAPGDYSPVILPNPWRILVEVRPRHASEEQANPRPSEPKIVASPYSLPNSLPAQPPVAAASQTQAGGRGDVTVAPFAIAGQEPELLARGPQVPDQPAWDHQRKAQENKLKSGTQPGDRPQATEVARARADGPAQPVAARPEPAAGGVASASAAHNEPPLAAGPAREARPTSTGERSLTRVLGLKISRIVIDAGHGGHDTGTLGPTGYSEKDLVLDVALRLGKLLESRMGAEVIYTREDDTFIPLEERTAIANHAGADLFLSIHANSSPDPSARGVETYYLNFSGSGESLQVAARENASSQKTVHELQDLLRNIALNEKLEESREFAGNIQRSLWTGEVAKAPGLRNRGVKKAPFVVLIGAHMPSVLAEISFVSNPADERRLRTPEYRQRIAESLYRGISRYATGLGGVKLASNGSPKPSGPTVAATPGRQNR